MSSFWNRVILSLQLGCDPKCARYSSGTTRRWTSSSCYRYNCYVRPWWWLCIWTSYYGERSRQTSVQLPFRPNIDWTHVLHLAALFLRPGIFTFLVILFSVWWLQQLAQTFNFFTNTDLIVKRTYLLYTSSFLEELYIYPKRESRRCIASGSSELADDKGVTVNCREIRFKDGGQSLSSW